jgi:hypothetical protein
MGLDMYLEADVGLCPYSPNGEELAATTLRAAIKANYGEAMDNHNSDIGLNVTLPLAYWRKANAIHGWFVRNVQNGKDECQRAYVEREQLERLREDCKTVLSDPSKAKELLPVVSGFFFGNYDPENGYDEYYVESLGYTVEAVDRILTKLPEGAHVYYHSSW